jgi:hypothetical protein
MNRILMRGTNTTRTQVCCEHRSNVKPQHDGVLCVGVCVCVCVFKCVCLPMYVCMCVQVCVCVCVCVV